MCQIGFQNLVEPILVPHCLEHTRCSRNSESLLPGQAYAYPIFLLLYLSVTLGKGMGKLEHAWRRVT